MNQGTTDIDAPLSGHPGYENVAVPFVKIGSRRAITGMQMAQEPWLRDFVERFKDSFEFHPAWDAMFFIEPC